MPAHAIEVTPNGHTVQDKGEWYEPATKHAPARHYPEARPALAAFGTDPQALARLLANHGTLHLSLFPGCRLALVVSNAILAEVPLPEPEYWPGMGAINAAAKAGILPT